jgi:hypothetical protein
LTTIKLDASTNVMFLIMRPLFIKLASLLTNILANHPLLRTPVFNVLYRLTLLPDPQPSLEMEALAVLDLRRAMAFLVHLYCLQLNGRLTFSSDLRMAQGSPSGKSVFAGSGLLRSIAADSPCWCL